MSLEPISLTESKRLVELEGVIKLHGAAFIAVGDALTEIRSAKLYRSDYETFEDYCKEVWGWSASRSRQLCAAAEIAKSVTTGNALTERSCRELAKIPAESREAVLAAAGERPTAKAITEAAKQIITPPDAAIPEHDAMAGIDKNKLNPVELTPKASELLELALRVRDDMDGLVDCIKGHNCDIQTLADRAETFGDTRAALVAYQMEIKRG